MRTNKPLEYCPVCQSPEFHPHIDTPSHMSNTRERFHFDQCERCQAIFLNPRIDQTLLGEYYKESYLPYQGAKAWGKYAPLVQKSLNRTENRKVGFCQKALHLDARSQVLDLGCGRPTFLQKLQQKTGCQATGLDFSSKGWKEESWDTLHLIEGELQTFESQETFDLITMWHYLEHDYTPAKSLQKLRGLLNENGKMLIEVPDADSISRKIQKQYWEGWHAPRHTVLYNPESMHFLLKSNGWEVVNIHRHGSMDAFTMYWLGRKEKQQINWSASMEKHFWPLVFQKILTSPLFLLEKWLPLGVMLFEVRKKRSL